MKVIAVKFIATAINRIIKSIAKESETEVQTFNFQETVQALDLDYLRETSISEFDSLQSIESCIEKWSDDLEYVVKHLLEFEYRARNVVFDKEVVGSDFSNKCFAKIIVRCGLLHSFIKFANAITKGKKEAIKLLKLLDIFASLNNLRVDFNRLFGGQTCVESRTQMRNLIKKVINEACDIFWELPTQVESLELNIQAWGRTYKDSSHSSSTLSCIFPMNSHWYLYNNLKGTKIGDVMGDIWLRGQKECVEHYASVFVRESWGKLAPLLTDQEEGMQVLFSGGGREVVEVRDSMKRRTAKRVWRICCAPYFSPSWQGSIAILLNPGT
ncbi:hypothetical protein AgCh_032217 [Apium graveolens]